MILDPQQKAMKPPVPVGIGMQVIFPICLKSTYPASRQYWKRIGIHFSGINDNVLPS